MLEKMKCRAMLASRGGGQGGTEYAILLAVIVIIIAIGAMVAGPIISNLWNNANSNLKLSDKNAAEHVPANQR